jgi:hypothetical protein
MLTRMVRLIQGKTQKDKFPKFNAFFFTHREKGVGKVHLFIYVWNPNIQKYTTAFFVNGTDYIDSSTLPELKKLISGLRKKTTLYKYTDHSPEELHETLKKKITSFYSLKWFQRQYQFVLQQKHLAENK